MENDNTLPKGIYWNAPHPQAPEFVKGRVSIKLADALPWLEAVKNETGYINLQLLETKDKSKLYLKLDLFQPKPKA